MIFPMDSMLAGNAQIGLVVALVIGFGFGFVLERAGFGRSTKLAAQFYLHDMTVFKVMFTAIVTGLLGLVILSGLGLADLETTPGAHSSVAVCRSASLCRRCDPDAPTATAVVFLGCQHDPCLRHSRLLGRQHQFPPGLARLVALQLILEVPERFGIALLIGLGDFDRFS